ncbi:MAG: hypothetical protein R2731_18475, partial [Nocardioides sp.]
CVPLDTDSGPVRLAWQVEQPEEDPGYVYLLADRGGESHLVGWGGDLITGDPRALDLGVSVEQLLAILTDPGFGMETSPELVAAGEDYLPEEAAPSAPATGQEPMTPGALAALSREYVGEEPAVVRDVSLRVDHQGPAALLRYGRGRRLVLGVVPGRLDPDECRTADECVELGNGVRLGWEVDHGPRDPGYLLVEGHRDGRTRFVLWQQPGISGDPRGGPLEGRLTQLTLLLQDPRFDLLTDPALVAGALELPPTDDTSGG